MTDRIYVRPIGFVPGPQSEHGNAIRLGGGMVYASRFAVVLRRDGRIVERWLAALDTIAEVLGQLPDAVAADAEAQWANLTLAHPALELGERTHGAALPETPVRWHEPTTIIGVSVPRDELVARLDERVNAMWRDGLIDEVRELRERGLERGVTARRAIGYAQALAQLAGEMTGAEAIAETKALTRRYARRQVSWFKRYEGVRWVAPGTPAAALADSTT